MQLSDFLDNLSGGVHEQTNYFLSWLRMEFKKIDPSYAMLRKQVEKTPNVEDMDLLERMVCAAILKQSGLSVESMLRSRTGMFRDPPPGRFLAVWQAVAQVFRWFWRRRNEIRSSGEIDASKVIPSVLESIIDAASLLLLVVPHPTSPMSLLHVPGTHDLSIPIAPREEIPKRQMHIKLHRALLLIRGVVRWQRLANYSRMCRLSLGSKTVDCNGKAIAIFLEQIGEGAVKAATNLPPSTGNKDISFELGSLVYLLLDNHRRAFTRDLGLRSFRLLLGTTKLPSLASEVLHALGPALRDPSSNDGHYLNKLNGVGERLHRQLQRSFESLYEDLAQKMGEVTGQITTFPAGQTETSVTTWDHSLLLTLIDAWGVTFKEGDWGFLVNLGIFDLLHKLMKSLTATLANTDASVTTSEGNVLPSR